MYKLAVIDLDGTMLNSYGVVTENTKNVLQKKIEEGMEIVIASGRTTSSILPIIDEIKGIRYVIAGNGSLIYDVQKQNVIYNKFMSKQKVLEIVKKCEENSIFYTIYTENEIITKSLKFNVLYYYKENMKKEESKRTKLKIVENVEEYVKNTEDINYLKIMLCDDNKLIFDSAIRKIKKIKNVEVLDIGHMSRKIIREGTQEIPLEYFYTEISLENVDKWEAIKYLSKLLNINNEEIMAIGDNINDKRMIENAGLGVAMRQSTPNITSIADVITDSNDEEGVAKILEKI